MRCGRGESLLLRTPSHSTDHASTTDMSLLAFFQKIRFSARPGQPPNLAGPSTARKESNAWLRVRCADIRGTVLSLGSGDDTDGEGSTYRHYFRSATSYTTSEVTKSVHCDLVIDIRAMPEISDESFDCVYCSGVLEHVDNLTAALDEITRILKRNGTLLLGLPFRQPLHLGPQDFWRFTEFGIRHLLKSHFEINELAPIDKAMDEDFPAAYWVRAIRSS